MNRLKTNNAEVAKVMEEKIRYFKNYRRRMNYSEYMDQGYHIGSGLAQSTCKHLAGARLKQSGMTD